MTPKEKAKELVDSFYQLFPLDKDVNTTDGELNWKYNDWNQSKKAALIAVDEMISVLPFTAIHRSLNDYAIHIHKYLEKVKNEIEQL